jgi:hypothetical protein
MAAAPARPQAPPPERNRPEVEAVYAHAPEHLDAEILGGTVLMSPRPAPQPMRAALRLYTRLYGPFDAGAGGPGGWLSLPAPALHLGARPDKLAPDLAGWRLHRLPQPPEGAAITVPPDWVCEVLSPSTEAIDRGLKMPLYAAHGVAHAWLLDPTERYLEVFRLDAGRWRQVLLARGDERVRAAPFDALALDLAPLWRWHGAASP